jgi:hypothetical protein
MIDIFSLLRFQMKHPFFVYVHTNSIIPLLDSMSSHHLFGISLKLYTQKKVGHMTVCKH